MKHSTLPLLAIASALALAGCCQRERSSSYSMSAATVTPHALKTHQKPATIPPRCTPAWKQLVDRRLQITDSVGHGPDIGSAEWLDAVGRKSGVTDAQGHGPDPGSAEWCGAVDYKVFGRR